MHFSLRISAFKAWRCIFAYLELIRGLNRLKINGVKILMYFGCPDKINTWRKIKSKKSCLKNRFSVFLRISYFHSYTYIHSIHKYMIIYNYFMMNMVNDEHADEHFFIL